GATENRCERSHRREVRLSEVRRVGPGESGCGFASWGSLRTQASAIFLPACRASIDLLLCFGSQENEDGEGADDRDPQSGPARSIQFKAELRLTRRRNRWEIERRRNFVQ